MKKNPYVYLDYNATTPVDQRVMLAMQPFFSLNFGNASSDHRNGWSTKEAVEMAREKIARLINASVNDIFFTSGATEAINMALFGLTEPGDEIITCKTEHKAVLETCAELERRERTVHYLDVNQSGEIDLNTLSDSVNDNTRLVSLMHSNNETGVIHPLEKISLPEHVLMMTDATQSLGKIPFDVQALGVDIATFSAHKLYGPKGIGAIYINERAKKRFSPLMYGGGQEKQIRPGTLNVPAAIGFGKACEICLNEMEEEAIRLSKLRNSFESRISDNLNVQFNGKKVNRLPHMTNITFHNIDGSNLIRRLKDLAVSRGSACNAVTQNPSHVLKAMGLTNDLAYSSIRVGLGRMTTEFQINYAIESIKKEIPKIRID